MSASPSEIASVNPAEYTALTSGVGIVEFDDWTLIEVTGDDRASFLHNLCTNEIRKLPAGAGCEAFLLNVQGKILFYVTIFSGPDALVLRTSPGQEERLAAHLDRYLIREKVTLTDRSRDWAELLLAGAAAAELLHRLGADDIPSERLQSVATRLRATTSESPQGGTSTIDVWLRRVDLTGGPGYLIDCQRGDFGGLRSLLVEAGATPCQRQTYEAKRIEAGTPENGSDVTEKNLPQEIDRDALAISFVKGCYLGQETVARIDALGHVNWMLRGVRFSARQMPAIGAELRSGSQVVGHVTSVSFSPKLGVALALAYVRRGHEQPGTKLESEAGPAEVMELPLA